MKPFDEEVEERVAANGRNRPLRDAARTFMRESTQPKYSYNFSWLGRPIIQYPQDIVAMQELIWSLQPDLIVETGIAHGGSLILWSSLLELNAACGGPRGWMGCGRAPLAVYRPAEGSELQRQPRERQASWNDRTVSLENSLPQLYSGPDPCPPGCGRA